MFVYVKCEIYRILLKMSKIRHYPVILIFAAMLSACAKSEMTRTSANSFMIDASAAPICGSTGAARVASKSAAVETLRSGYDRYIITGSQAQNNVTATQMPGTVYTSGTYGGGTYNARSTYVPGGTMYSGTHDKSLVVVMFKKGQPGWAQAVDAKETLGPQWEELVKSGIRTCG